MEDGYITPIEQIINNLSLKCPDAPKRPILRPKFQEPLNCKKLALPMTRPVVGGLTLKGYNLKSSKK